MGRADWYYHRTNCATCSKAQVFLAEHSVAIGEQTDAKKRRFERDEALALARQAEVLVVVKGKKVVRVDMKQPPGDDALAELLLGPSGKLRAPSLRRGKTLLIGFDEGAYAELLQGRDAS
jgi:arsenate reductase-like glutaredoxin family protein